jgi:hypothetical protein
MHRESAILQLVIATETQNGFEMAVVAGSHAQYRVRRRCDGTDKQGGRQQGREQFIGSSIHVDLLYCNDPESQT